MLNHANDRTTADQALHVIVIDPSVGGEQHGSVLFGGCDVHCVGVTQRPGREGPYTVHVNPWCRFDQDLQRFRVLECLREIGGLKG